MIPASPDNPEIAPEAAGPPGRPAFVALSARFIRRTVVATVVTVVLVAAVAVTYGHARWGAFYLVSGVWSLVFLSLTPLIVKAFVFDRRPMAGLALSAVKIVWLALLVTLCMKARQLPVTPLIFKSALIAGLTTPLVVLVLRTLGAMMQEKAEATGAISQAPGQPPPMEPKV